MEYEALLIFLKNPKTRLYTRLWYYSCFQNLHHSRYNSLTVKNLQNIRISSLTIGLIPYYFSTDSGDVHWLHMLRTESAWRVIMGLFTNFIDIPLYWPAESSIINWNVRISSSSIPFIIHRLCHSNLCFSWKKLVFIKFKRLENEIL